MFNYHSCKILRKNYVMMKNTDMDNEKAYPTDGKARWMARSTSLIQVDFLFILQMFD